MPTESLFSPKVLRDAAESVGPVRSSMAWLGKTFYPNRLTAVRLVPGLGAVLLHMASLPVFSAGCAIGAAVWDWVDGAAARASGRMSAEGARLDPLVDKVVHGVQLSYLAILGASSGQGSGTALAVTAALNLAVDLWSQSRRGPLGDQVREAVRAILRPETCTPGASVHQANFWGKAKFALQAGGIVTAILSGGDSSAVWAASGCLAASAALGAKGVLRRPAVSVPVVGKAA